MLALEDGGGPEEPKSKRGRGRPPNPKPVKLDPEELANILLVPGLLLLSAKWIELPALRPNDQESLGFCAPLARIICRHLPAIPASEDVIDLGRMALAGIGYWMRVQPVLMALKEAQENVSAKPIQSTIEEGGNGRNAEILNGQPGRSGLALGSA